MLLGTRTVFRSLWLIWRKDHLHLETPRFDRDLAGCKASLRRDVVTARALDFLGSLKTEGISRIIAILS
jgi:hypothetical protein